MKVSRDGLLEAELFSDPTCSAPPPPTSHQDTVRVRVGKERASSILTSGLTGLLLRRSPVLPAGTGSLQRPHCPPAVCSGGAESQSRLRLPQSVEMHRTRLGSWASSRPDLALT